MNDRPEPSQPAPPGVPRARAPKRLFELLGSHNAIAALALAAIVANLVLRFGANVRGHLQRAAPGRSGAGRRAAGVRAGSAAPGSTVRLRPAGRHVDRHFDVSRGVSSRHVRGADALGRRRAGVLCRAQRRRACSRRWPSACPRRPICAARRAGRRAVGSGRRRRTVADSAARDLPGRRHRDRRARRDGRVVSHRRAVHDVQDARLAGLLRRDQRRIGVDDRSHAARRRFALCQDHASDASLAATAATDSPLRRSTRRVLHAACAGDCRGGMGGKRRGHAIFGGAGGGHAVPAVDCNSSGDHRLDFAGRAARHHHQGSGGARTSRTVPHRDPRQDRHAHLRPAAPGGTARGRQASIAPACWP